MLEYLGCIAANTQDEEPVKHLYVMSVSRLRDWPAKLELPSSNFALLLMGNLESVDEDEAASMARLALKQGCALVIAPPRIEDVFDLQQVRLIPEPTDKTVIITIGLGQDLEEALYEFLFVFLPAESYLSSCKTWLICNVGSGGLASLKSALSDLQGLHDRILHEFVASLPDYERANLEDDAKGVIEFVPAPRASSPDV